MTYVAVSGNQVYINEGYIPLFSKRTIPLDALCSVMFLPTLGGQGAIAMTSE